MYSVVAAVGRRATSKTAQRCGVDLAQRRTGCGGQAIAQRAWFATTTSVSRDSEGTPSSRPAVQSSPSGGVIAEADVSWLLNSKEVDMGRTKGKEKAARKTKDKATGMAAKTSKSKSDRASGAPKDAGDAEQGASRADELGPRGQAWPPLAKDVLTNMARFPSCILLTRVGGFYESYFDQAPILANLLRIKLTTRVWGGRTVTMAGFPIFQLEKYLKRLVIDHRKLVAICDEFKEITLADGTKRQRISPRHENPFAPSVSKQQASNEKVEIRRKVTRVVSPGTLIDEYFLDPFASNWVMAVSRIRDSQTDKHRYGLAWLDVSTADFNTTICEDAQSMRDEIARVGPIEIVLEPGEFTQHHDDGQAVAGAMTNEGEPGSFIIQDGPLWEAVDPNKVHISFCHRQPVHRNDDPTTPSIEPTAEDYAVANLTAHLRTRLLDFEMDNVNDLTGSADGPIRRRRESVMTIDASTLSALEINTAQRREEASFNALSSTLSIKGSLLSYVRRTVTKGGARLLAQWLTSPSTSLPLIHRRQALVALFLAHPFMAEDFRGILRKRAGDINRALQRILTSRNDEQDLLEVRDFTRMCKDIVEQLRRELKMAQGDGGAPIIENADGWEALSSVLDVFEDLSALGDRLGEAIDESVIDKRLQAQEDRMRQMQMEVMGEAGKSHEESTAIAAAAARRKKASAAASSSQDTGLWGAAFEHLIRPSSSEQLSLLTKEHHALRRKASKLEGEMRARFGDRITLRFLLGQGYIVHSGEVYKMAAATLTEMEGEMQLAYKSKSTRTYYNEQWTRIGSRISKVEQELQEKETIELQRLRLDVLVELGRLRKNAAMVHELDVLAGFGMLAGELKLVRPTVNDGDVLHIEQGRHLGVEMSLIHQQEQKQQFQSALMGTGSVDSATTSTSRPFTPNDVHLHQDSRLHLITGPNMGGKSTLLRMVAIITILAQVGSFVPAAQCTIGVVDQIFSRIGAHDAIHADRSTFMVEMLEVAQFLRRSTQRSLIICDEVGRGTDSETGAAIAFATAVELAQTIQCKCLFATHLHAVGDLLRDVKGVDYFCTDLEETQHGEIMFSHRLRPGMNRNSHGLTIARLAGMPEGVLDKAYETMKKLQQDSPSSSS